MAPPESVYDEHADWYADVVRRRALIHLQIIPQIMEFIGDVSGRHVIDVACGEGVFSRELGAQGARVTAVDLSRRLLGIAKTTPRHSKLTYVHDDARTLSTLQDAAFGGATCIMAMMDIDDIGATFESVHRVTRGEAWFVVVITHPCFESPHARSDVIDGRRVRVTTQYLTEGPWRGTENGVRSRFGAHHRTISTYLNTAIATGWSLARSVEPPLAKVDANLAWPAGDDPGLLMLRFRRHQ